MRQGEIRNLKLQDIHLKNTDVQSHYEDLGTDPRIKEQNRENVIYIPSRHNRPGNKSKRHRLLPLDDEVRRTLLDYLLIRPDCGEPWVFVTQTDHEHITDKDRLNEIWREEVASQIDTKERHRPIRSHFGRHWFTSYWRVQEDLNRELIQYMRGDKIGKSYSQNEAIDEYIHAYFEDIKEEYLSKVFKFNI
jgi:integrase/recombinase XerD